MFDLNFGKLLLLAVLALIVLGPERLPKAARMAGVMLRRARRSWDSVRTEVERELQLEDIKQAAQDAKAQAESFRTAATDMASDARGAFDDTVAEVKDFANMDVLGEKDGASGATASADTDEESGAIAYESVADVEPVETVAMDETDQESDAIAYEAAAGVKQSAYVDALDATDDAPSAAATEDADEDSGAIPYRRVADVKPVASVATEDRDGHA